uniref:fibronectin type III domain-containing protein n=1 Tax=Flavobacterium sp. TaxID=239 RepID=UPI0037BFC022
MIKSITQKGTKNLVRNLNSYPISCIKPIKHLTCLLILLFSSMGWGQVYLANQSFDGTTFVPSSWTNLLTSGSNTWTRATSGTYPTCSPRSGTGMAMFNSYSSPGTGVRSLITPVLDFSTAGTKRITFWMYRDNGYPTDADKIEIYTNTSANLTGATLLGTINRSRSLAPTVGSDGWYEYFYDVTTTSATTYVIFKAIGAYGNNMYVDDIKVEAPPTPCSGTPTAGTISTANQYLCSGATVPNLVNTGFSSGVTGITFQWEQSTDNATWANVTTGTGATTATYTPPAFAGTTIYYRCNVTCANGGGAAATPSVSINPPANPVTQVTNAVASSISYTGFTTTWVNGNGNRRVVYLSDTAIVDPSNATGAAVHTANTVYTGSGQQIVYDGTGTSVSVTGLTLGTTYYVKVFEYTRCGAAPYDYYYSAISGTNAISVSTSSISPTPWSEGFATGVATFPNWLVTAGSVGTITAVNPALSSNYYYVNLYGTQPVAAITTPIIGSMPSNYRFVVKYKLANYSSPYAPPASGSGNFIVAISTDNGSSYTDVETIANNAVAGWQEYILNLSAYVGQNIRIRLTGNRTSGDYYLAFDNYSVEAIPSCLSPNTLVLSSITNNSASLSWTAPASAPGSGYDVYYSTTNTAPTAGTTPSANVPSGTTYAFSGLTASTTYYSWVRSNCGSGDVSLWVASASFTTSCNPVSSLPWTEGFEGLSSVSTTTFPSCWLEGTGINWGSLSASTSSYNDPRTGNYYIGCMYGGTNDRIWTPGFQLTAGVSYDFSTYFVGDGYSGWTGDIVYNTSALASGETVLGTSFITSSTASTTAINYSQITRTFVPSTSGIYYFGIRITSSYVPYSYLAFDDFKLELSPTCSAPTSLSISSITNSAANLSWTAPASAPASGYDVYYSTTNTAPIAGTSPTANVSSGTNYAFTGLTASTTYYSWVRSNCGSGDLSTWAASASFTTQCNPVSVPYSQDFESVTIPALPICTSIENAGTGNNWKTASPGLYGFTTKCLNYSYNGNNPANAWFYTAGINLTAGTSYRISYNYGSSSTTSYPENLKVAYGVAASSASMTTTLATHTNILTNSAPSSTVDFTPSTTGIYYFGFNAFSDTDMEDLYVDNISIILTPNTWTGTTSNSWSTASNWSLSTVPTSSDDVLISSNGSNAPVMDVDVTIPAGKSLTVSGTGTLNIAPGKVLTIAGTANFGARPVTFKSDATGTAMLGPLTTGTLAGATSVTVERYIPLGKRAFRLLSPAVTTSNNISQNWQLATHITGTSGASGGFDVTETNNPSMYTYDNQAAQGVSGWTPIANTNNTNLIAGVGYRVLIRGDKTPANITSASADNMNAAITLSATGTLKTGTVALSSGSTPSINNTANTITNGHSLVGNPYQSAVDWHLVTKTGIEETYYAWAPNMGTGTARGNYVAYNVSTGNSGGGSVGQFIQPGQAFFVKNTGSSAGILTFEEADKATTSANVFRTANTPSLGVALYDPNELAIGGYPIDATKAVFSSEYSNELGLGDATKLEAAGENIAWFRNNTKLAIDAAAPVTTSDELAMKTMRLGANKNYTFKIQTTNFDTALTPYLVDTFLNTQTEIATSQAFLASFATTSNQASYSEDRFKIVFQTSAL